MPKTVSDGQQIGARAPGGSNLSQADGNGESILLERGTRAALPEQIARSIVDTSPALTYILDLENRHNVFISPQVAEVLGYTPDDVAAMGADLLPRLLHEDDVPTAAKRIDALIADRSGETFSAEYRMRRKTGEYVWLDDRARVFERGEDGVPRSVLGVTSDITRRVEAEEALRGSERRFRAVFDHQFQFSALLTPEGRILQVGASALRTLDGTTEDDLVGLPFVDAPWWRSLPDTRAVWERLLAEAIAEGVSSRAEVKFVMAGGIQRSSIVTLTSIRDGRRGKGDGVEFLLAEGVDITERRELEDSARERFEELESIYRTAPIGLGLFDREFRFRRINDRLAEINGLSAADHIGRRIKDVVPDLADVGEALCARVFDSGEPVLNVEIRGRTEADAPDAEHVWNESFYPVFDRDGRAQFVSVVVEEITDRKLADERLRASEAELKFALKAGGLGNWRMSLPDKLVTCSDTCRSIFGLAANGEGGENAEREAFFDRIAAEDRPAFDEAVSRAIETGGEFALEHRVVAGGVQRWVRTCGITVFDDAADASRRLPHSIYGTAEDVTERKQRELNAALLDEIGIDMMLLSDSDEIIRAVGRRVTKFLGISSCFFTDVDETRGEVTASCGWTESTGLVIGQPYRLADYISEDFGRDQRAGKTFVVVDSANDPRTNGERYAAVGFGSFVTVPHISRGRWSSFLAATNVAPRAWSENDVALLREVAGRIFPRIERARAEAAERYQLQLNRSITDTAAVAIFVCDRRGRATFINPEAEEVFGWSLDEIADRNLLEVIGRDSVGGAVHPGECPLGRVFAEGEPVRDHEGVFYRRDGSAVTMICSNRPVVESGTVVGVVMTMLDISGRRRQEEAIRRSEERLRLAESAARGFNYEWNLDDGMVTRSDSIVRVLGYEPDELAPTWKAWADIIHPDDLPVRTETEAVEMLTSATAAGESQYSGEFRVRHKDGRWVWLMERALVTFDGDARRPRRVIGQTIDVTARREAELALIEAERRAARDYQKLLSRIAPLAQTLGMSRDPADIYRALDSFLSAELPCEEFLVSLDDADKGGERIVFARRSAGFAGRPHSALTPMIVSGRAIGTLEVRCGDLEYTRENLVALEMAANLAAVALENLRLIRIESEARVEAENANRLKDEFLATVSHELRTPLNAILGWATIARRTGLDGEFATATVGRALEVIERSAQSQNQLISDILDVSRIITGKLHLELAAVELSAIIVAAVDTVKPLLENKEIELATDIAGTGRDAAEPLFMGDADRLQQVVWNLLSNAAKFTPAGGRIEVALRYSKAQAEIVVRDTGEGIPAEFLPFVFDRFSQADGRKNRRHGGLGLGLAVVRHVTEIHGGTVAVASAGEGRGAEFTVRLPLRGANARKAPSVRGGGGGTPSAGYGGAPDRDLASGVGDDGRALRHLKVLVVDDEPDANELSAYILAEHGARVRTAGSVDAALEIYDRESDFDIIVSDIGMPEKDGLELMRVLRGRFESNERRIPVLALTAYVGEKDRSEVLDAGFRGHLSKPLDPAALIEAVTNLVGGVGT